jgi:GNAT superfamily N-acetyltransferase
MNDIEIRFAHREDIEAIMKLYSQLVPDDVAPDPRAVEATWYEILAHDETYRYVVAAVDGTIAATCNVTIVPNLTRGVRPFAVIENVVTASAHRKHGLGAAVMRMAVDFAASKNCYKVMLLSNSKRKEAHAFYRAIGFNDTDKIGFYKNLDS